MIASIKSVMGLDLKNDLEIENAWLDMRSQGSALMPLFREAFLQFKNAKGRVALVFYATAYIRVSDDALKLGLSALEDRSKLVRNRVCGFLTYSLRSDAAPFLQALKADPDQAVRESATAAISTIKACNHHLFVDRTALGGIRWVVNPEDNA